MGLVFELALTVGGLVWFVVLVLLGVYCLVASGFVCLVWVI